MRSIFLCYKNPNFTAHLRIIKIILAITVVMIFSIGILATMALEKFKTTLTLASESQISVIAFDVRDNIEKGLSLGIDLQAMQNVQQALQRALPRDKKIAAIYVISRQGEILYRTPDSTTDIPQKSIEIFQRAILKQSISSRREGDFINTITALKNSFAQTVGLLVVKYDATLLQKRLALFQREVLQQALLFLAVGIGVMTLIVWRVLKRFDHTETLLAQALDAPSSATALTPTSRVVECPEVKNFQAQERELLGAVVGAEKLLETL